MTGDWQTKNYCKESETKTILILVTNSFAAMNVIHSGLLRKLSSRYKIHILSTMIGSREILWINAHYQMQIDLIDMDLPQESLLISVLRRFEKVLFFSLFKIETFRIKALRMNPIVRFVIWLVELFCLSGLAKPLLMMIRRLIISLSARLPGLSIKEGQFDGVISTSPLNIRENSIVNFLSGKAVKTLAMIISWDNLTSTKGVINANHDYVLVWNKIMAHEFDRFYTIFRPKEKICITGIPRFDIYFDNCISNSEVQFRMKFGIPTGNKIILLATTAQKHFPTQSEIVAHLAEYVRMRRNVTVIVRCHPADHIQLYVHFLKTENIHLCHPQKEYAENERMFYKWLPHPEFLNSLADMLKNCDVCIQTASTICLDANACRKPVISIAYDGNEELQYRQSVKRLYDYSHQLPLHNAGIAQMVYSKQQLFSALDQILKSPNPERDFLSPILPLIHRTDAKSVDSTLKYVAQWLQ